MIKNWTVVAGLALFLFSPGPSISRADEEIREVVLTSRVEQGLKIWSPPKIFAKKGETLKIRLENQTEVVHGFTIEGLTDPVQEQVLGGQEKELTLHLRESGTFPYFCFIHKTHQGGELIVE